MWETEDTLAPTSTSWKPQGWPGKPCQLSSPPPTGDVGVLQKKLVPFITELNMHLVQELEKLKEDPGEGGAAAGLAAGLTVAPYQRGEPADNDV